MEIGKRRKSDTKYVICNADEGEPGTFKDREILDVVPSKVLVGMCICAYAIGAKEGFVYLRNEYNFLLKDLIPMIEKFNKNIQKLGLDFHIKILL